MKSLFLALGLLAFQQAPSNQVLTQFPAVFHGEWAERLETCGTGDNDDRLIISATEAQFYEANGTLVSGVWCSNDVLRTTLSMTEHEEEWTSTNNWVVADGGQTLVWEGEDNSRQQWSRCPTP